MPPPADDLKEGAATTTIQKSSASDSETDDLDDVLDQFTHGAQGKSTLAVPLTKSTSASGRPRTNTRVDARPISIPGPVKAAATAGTAGTTGLGTTAEEVPDEDELARAFTRELEKGMEELLKDMSRGCVDEEDVGLQGEKSDKGNKPSSSSSPQTNEFQHTIKQAMDKLRDSESRLKEGSSSNSGTGLDIDSLEALVKQLDGEGTGDDELAEMLEDMMGQLLTKDVLYEPLKELNESFPKYLDNPPTPLADTDRKRYESQLGCVKAILAAFDDPKYDEKDRFWKEKVLELTNDLQSYGPPPSEVMGPLPPELSLGPDGMPQGCVVS